MNELHGKVKTPEYNSWRHMKSRCNDRNDDRYELYGGRGIMVCERWSNSFVTFLEDMGEKPNPEYSIERIDTNGDYEPNNCKWATRSEQMINRRRFTRSEKARVEQSVRTKGIKKSEGFGKKISIAMQGNKNCVGRILSEETKKRISESNKFTKSKKLLTLTI